MGKHLRDASCSHQYCPSSTSYHSVFVALAVVGDFVHGNKAYLCPPPRPEISNRLLDSCVDDQKNPSIFVIFEKNQIYPAYILEYTCRVLSERSSKLSPQGCHTMKAPCPFRKLWLESIEWQEEMKEIMCFDQYRGIPASHGQHQLAVEYLLEEVVVSAK
ncbi:Poly [ADP-ribose] polymerase 12 [Anas platyrhynchos]|uniref:Poly [ADP-ribose] polymerase 12 n=1 Tax=Anas platyrhynchos TaxID=8839 RepID=R0JRV1_ANAPL|nr:Poly [ADP-ribose] polymerase 12 [Anas platyrhynchos]